MHQSVASGSAHSSSGAASPRSPSASASTAPTSHAHKGIRRMSSFRKLAERPFFPPAESLAERVFLLFENPNASLGGFIAAVTVMVTIFVSTISFCVETMPEMRGANRACGRCVPNATETGLDPVCGVTHGAGFSPSAALTADDCAPPAARGVRHD